MPGFRPTVVLCLSLALAASGCATYRFRTVDHYFAADRVSKTELDGIARDIRENSEGSVIILVKYKLAEPFLSTQTLAQTQGRLIQTYLKDQGVRAPMQVHTTPAQIVPNQIWISYQVRTAGSAKSAAPEPAPEPKPEKKVAPVFGPPVPPGKTVSIDT